MAVMPRAKRDGVLVESVDGELLVYDYSRQRLHWLNHTAALVWGLCDGRTTIAAMVTQLRERHAIAAGDDFVALTVRRLAGDGLLAEPVQWPDSTEPPARRDLARTAGCDGLGAAEPEVVSISLRTVVHAESSAPCRGPGETCGVAQPPCCPGLTYQMGPQMTGTCVS